MYTICRNAKLDGKKVVGRGPSRIYPFDRMGVGDSIFIPGQANHGNNGLNCSGYVSALTYGKRHNIKFTSRSNDKGIRIWRIK